MDSTAENCSRHGWADSLQNSEIRGQRHLTDRTRARDEQMRSAAAFEKQLLQNLPPNHPLRRQAEESEEEQRRISEI